MNGRRLNLGCGDLYLDGYINCDVLPHIKADKYFDLNRFPYPFNESSIDEILLDNVLEHLPDVVGVMRELHRILKHGAILKIYVPYGKADRAIQDPPHVHFFTENKYGLFYRGLSF